MASGMNRLEEMFEKLGYRKENGLFYHHDAEEWFHKFPYRISHVLRDIIQPYAFFCLFYGGTSGTKGHPVPMNNPFILFFDNPEAEIEQEIPGWTFSFGQAPVVIINREAGASLEIYHGYAFDGEKDWLKKIDTDLNELSITKLITGESWKKLYKKYFEETPKVDKLLLKNLIDARRILIAKDVNGLPHKTVNRLIGRALFIRYLIDRKVSFEDSRYIRGTNKSEQQVSFENLLKHKKELYKFFNTIIKKFNGDLFPLIEKDENNVILYDEEEIVKQEHLDVIHHLFSGSSFFAGDGRVKNYAVHESFFRFYDFEVIPVELISNIYENFLGESKEISNKPFELETFSGSRQEEIKAYYTPPFLVDFILAQTVTPFLERQDKPSCRVLDPACGSGIFLVETLRKIIEKEIKANPKNGPGNRVIVPDTRLWQLVHENIFGIDIDEEAIEIAVFSLYITLLDYKTPKEIKGFRFEKLKDRNFFGGDGADFFNEGHPFNKIFKDEIELDFIIGNPPWGKVKTSRYYEYIKGRNKREKEEHPEEYIELEISKKEISQAFMVRVSDFVKPGKNTKCVFIVSGKNIYNTSRPYKTWRNYFLGKFFLTQVVELSSVNNKIAGGNQIFEAAKQSVVITSFYPAEPGEDTSVNMVRHITVRPNRFFNYFSTVVVEKPDFKNIMQKYFMESKGGYDWLWKVLLHGNILDFYFVKRLKGEFRTFEELTEEYNLGYKGGLKLKDNSIKPEKRKSTEAIKNWSFIEVDSRKEFRPFNLCPSLTWKEKARELTASKGKIYDDAKVGFLPDIYFFEGKKLLFKKGLLSGENFKAVAAFSDEDIVFTSTVCSVKPKKGIEYSREIDTILKNMVGLFNSRLFTYFILCTGSSVGVDRTRADFDEFFSFPVSLNKEIGRLTIKLQDIYKKTNELFSNPVLKKELTHCQEELNRTIMKAYRINEQEQALIDYAVEVSLPVIKREGYRKGGWADIFEPLSFGNQKDKDYLKKYAKVFVDHFSERFAAENKFFFVEIHITVDFIGFHFRVTGQQEMAGKIVFRTDGDALDMINEIGNLGVYHLSKDLYIQQDIRGFNKDSFYVIKPNRKKSWHKAAAFADLSEFINSLVRAEMRRQREIA